MTAPHKICQACRVHGEHDRCTGENTLGTSKCQCNCRDVLEMFLGCDTRAGLASALQVALLDNDVGTPEVNRLYHAALDEKGWR